VKAGQPLEALHKASGLTASNWIDCVQLDELGA
jgi:hypothetical protein